VLASPFLAHSSEGVGGGGWRARTFARSSHPLISRVPSLASRARPRSRLVYPPRSLSRATPPHRSFVTPSRLVSKGPGSFVPLARATRRTDRSYHSSAPSKLTRRLRLRSDPSLAVLASHAAPSLVSQFGAPTPLRRGPVRRRGGVPLLRNEGSEKELAAS
jgi:hypothetical protein